MSNFILTILHSNHIFDISLSNDCCINDFQDIIEEEIGVPKNKQKFIGIINNRTNKSIKVKDHSPFFKDSTIKLMGKSIKKYKQETIIININNAINDITNYINNNKISDIEKNARIIYILNNIEYTIQQDKSTKSPELREFLEQYSTYGGSVTTVINRLLSIIPSYGTSNEFNIFFNNLKEEYNKKDKLSPSTSNKFKTYANSSPELFTDDHIEFLMDMNDITKLKLIKSFDMIIEKNVTVFITQIPKLIDMSNNNTKFSHVTIRTLLQIAKQQVEAVKLFISEIFYTIFDSDNINTKYTHGPSLITFVCKDDNELRLKAISLLFDLTKDCPDKYLLLLLNQIYSLALKDPLLLNPYAKDIILFQNHSLSYVSKFSNYLWKLLQGENTEDMQNIIESVNSNNSDEFEKSIQKLITRLNSIEEISIDTKNKVSESINNMEIIESKNKSWRDSIDEKLIKQDIQVLQLKDISSEHSETIQDVKNDLEEQKIKIDNAYNEMKQYVDNNIALLKDFIAQIIKKLPIPVRFSTEGTIRKSILLHFICGKRSDSCIHSFNTTFTTSTKEWNKWLKIGVSALMLGHAVFSKNPKNIFTNIRDIYKDFTKRDDDDFMKFTQEPFLTSEEQDRLIKQLRESTFYNVFAYDAQIGDWVCTSCRSKTKIEQSTNDIHKDIIDNKEDSIPTLDEQDTKLDDIIMQSTIEKQQVIVNNEIEESTKQQPSQVKRKLITSYALDDDTPIIISDNKEKKNTDNNNNNTSDSVKRYTSIFDMTAAEDIDSLTNALESGLNVNTKNDTGKTLLHCAVLTGNFDIIQYLLQKGAKITILDQNNKTALLQQGVTDQVKQLVLSTLRYRQEFILDNLSQTCLICNKPFGLFTRRHHCRHCGLLLCSECSPHNFSLPSFNFPIPVRICKICIKPIQQARKHLWKIEK